MIEVPLRARDGSVRAVALIDDEDADLVLTHRWCLTAKGYAERKSTLNGRWFSVRMHRLILGLGSGDLRQGDHINGDRLDNRRSNLRVCEASQQAQNVRRASDLPRGVSRRSGGRYQAQTRLDGCLHYLGLYDTPERAAEVAADFRRCWMPLAVA